MRTPATCRDPIPIWGHRWFQFDYPENGYHRRQHAIPLLYFRVVHHFLGPRNGCSCSRCMWHPKRRITGAEAIEKNVRISELSRRVIELERKLGIADRALREAEVALRR